MATENEELKLTVTLVDQALPHFLKLNDQIKKVGGAENKDALDRFRKSNDEARRHLTPLGEDISKATERLLPFSKGIVGAATGILGLGVALTQGLNTLKNYATAMTHLHALASQTGIHAAVIKSMREQFEQAGVGAVAAEKNIAGLAHSMVDIGRVHSELRQKLLEGQSPENRPAMEAYIGELATLANDPEAFANKIKEGADNIYKNVEKEFGSERAAEARRNFLALFGMPDIDQVIGNFRKVSQAEKDQQDRRDAAAREFLAKSVQISQNWDKIKDSMEASAVKELMPALDKVDKLLDRLGEKFGGFEGAFKPLNDFISTTADEINGILNAFEKAGQWIDTVKKWLSSPIEIAPQWLKDKITQTLKQAVFPTFGHAAEETGGKAAGPADAGAADAGAAPYPFADLGSRPEDRLHATKDLADQFTKLNDFLQAPGGVQMQGLAGLPGMRGPGGDPSAPSSGPGAAAPSGPGGPRGAPDSTTAPTDSNGPGAPTPGVGEGVGPAQAIAIARQHLNEDEIRDETKLSNFFREAGIKISPRVTAWCAGFVNANLAKAGVKGTGSLAAYSFLRWGQGVSDKTPIAEGDVAVFKSHSHVALLTGETKMVNGVEMVKEIGGNQGGTVSGRGGVTERWVPRSSVVIRRAGERELAGLRARTDKQLSGIDTKGNVNVTVTAPKPTTVEAQGDGVFKGSVSVTRRAAAEAAPAAPAAQESVAAGPG